MIAFHHTVLISTGFVKRLPQMPQALTCEVWHDEKWQLRSHDAEESAWLSLPNPLMRLQQRALIHAPGGEQGEKLLLGQKVQPGRTASPGSMGSGQTQPWNAPPASAGEDWGSTWIYAVEHKAAGAANLRSRRGWQAAAVQWRGKRAPRAVCHFIPHTHTHTHTHTHPSGISYTVRTHTRTHKHAHARMHTHAGMHTHPSLSFHTQVGTHSYAHTHTHTHTHGPVCHFIHCAHTHTHTPVCHFIHRAYTHTHTHTHARTPVCHFIHSAQACTHAHTHTYTLIHIHSYTHTLSYTHTHTRTHTHTYTHIPDGLFIER